MLRILYRKPSFHQVWMKFVPQLLKSSQLFYYQHPEFTKQTSCYSCNSCFQVQKAEQNTEMIMVELHGKTNMLNETQSTLVEKDKEIDQEKRKMAELEQKIVEMQGDQEATGDRFAQERNELAEKLHTMTCDFKSVSSKLEMAQKENDHLKTAFIKVQTEFVQKKNENEELRKAFQQNFLELKSKESELAETKSSHKVLSEKYQELRKKSVEIERKRKDAEGKALQLENEVSFSLTIEFLATVLSLK